MSLRAAIFAALAILGIALLDDIAEEPGQLGETVRRAIAVAGRPVTIPVADHVAGARLHAAAAFRAMAQGGLHRAVGLDLDRGQNGCENDAGTVFGREQLEVEANGAEARLARGAQQADVA